MLSVVVDTDVELLFDCVYVEKHTHTHNGGSSEGLSLQAKLLFGLGMALDKC